MPSATTPGSSGLYDVLVVGAGLAGLACAGDGEGVGAGGDSTAASSASTAGATAAATAAAGGDAADQRGQQKQTAEQRAPGTTTGWDGEECEYAEREAAEEYARCGTEGR